MAKLNSFDDIMIRKEPLVIKHVSCAFVDFNARIEVTTLRLRSSTLRNRHLFEKYESLRDALVLVKERRGFPFFFNTPSRGTLVLIQDDNDIIEVILKFS